MSKFTKKGVTLTAIKEPAASRPIVDIAPLSQISVPLLSAGDDSLLSVVKINQTVLQGDLLGIAELETKLPIYAPVSGVLAGFREIQHPLLGNVSCAVLNCITSDSKYNNQKNQSPANKTNDYIKLAQTMGIIDELDGIPLAKKLTQWKNIKSVCLIADAGEHEPYSSSAWSVLNESADKVEKGLELAALSIQATSRHIAVMLPKKEIKKLKSILNTDIIQLTGKYPAKSVFGAKNICRIGVQACLALYYAVEHDRPPCSVVVTVAGDAVTNSQNVRVPIGTLVDDVLRFCGLLSRPEHVIIGDAMTGITINRSDIPVIPGITCVIALKNCPRPPVHPCIGCGRCVSACHAGLLPYEIMRRLDNMQYERLASLLAEDCDGCGACSYVCPSGLDVAAKVIEARDLNGNIFLKWGNGDDI